MLQCKTMNNNNLWISEALIKFWMGNLSALPPAFKKLLSSITNSGIFTNIEFQPSFPLKQPDKCFSSETQSIPLKVV